MRIGFHALAVRSHPSDGLSVSLQRLFPALVTASDPTDQWVVYTQRSIPLRFLPDDPRIKRVVPWWPVGWRSGQITWEQFRLYSRVFRDRVDLLHAPSYTLPRLTVKPTVITIPDAFALRQPADIPRPWRRHYAYILPYSVRLARRILIPSEYVRQEILAWNREEKQPVPTLEERMVVLPFGIAPQFFEEVSTERQEEVAYRYGLPKKFVLVFGPTGESRRNVQRAIEAYFAATLSRRLPHRLVLVGPCDRTIATLLQQLGLEAKTVRLPWVEEEDLPVVYRLASVLLHPPRASGFGAPILESLACGTPVVASDLPPFREIAGDAVRYVSPDHLPSWREATEEVLVKEEQHRAFTAEGRRIASLFSLDRCAARLLALYRQTIEEDLTRWKDGARPSPSPC